MGKYLSLGFILAIALFLITSVMINHSSNTTNMQAIDTGIKTSVLGEMRNNEDTDGYGMRAKDVVAVITQEVTENQSDSKKTTTIDFKFFEDEEGNKPIPSKEDIGKIENNISLTKEEKEVELKKLFDSVISNNSIIKSVQYKVNLYNSRDVTTNSSGETIIKDGAQAESSTENRIILNKTL